MSQFSAPHEPAQPWWRYKIMWLVVGAPLIVVIAATATGVIAFRNADQTLSEAPTAAQTARGDSQQRSHAPAQQARNHAATPVAAEANNATDVKPESVRAKP